MPGHEDIFQEGEEKGPYIETGSGMRFYIQHPEFNIEDIAEGLAKSCRYNGHCSKFYSVAEHSYMVSLLVHPTRALTGLMHDATEAYLSDVPAPFKQLLPDWKEIDVALEAKLYEHFGLEHHQDIKECDWLALFIEAYHLLPSKGVGWTDPDNYRQQAIELLAAEPMWTPQGWSWQYAEKKFLERYYDLTYQA